MIRRVGPLGLLWEALWENCIVSAELAVLFKGEAYLCKRVSSFLFGAVGSSVIAEAGQGPGYSLLNRFLISLFAGLRGIGS